ncbi:Uncharacterised protein [Streptococcus pneumoniae]|nr:Uncharacterised protein [Streptococcus pneumoniae]
MAKFKPERTFIVLAGFSPIMVEETLNGDPPKRSLRIKTSSSFEIASKIFCLSSSADIPSTKSIASTFS